MGSMQKKLISFIVVVIVLVAISFLVRQYSTIGSAAANNQQGSATTTTDAGWQVYQDSADGLSFEYPSTFQATSTNYNGYSVARVYDPDTNAGYVSIMIVDDPSQPDTAELFTGPYPKEIPPTGNESTTTVVQKTLDGLQGIEAYGYIAEGSEYSDVFMYENDHLWEVNLDPVLEGRITTYPQPGTPTPDKNTYERILASIKISSESAESDQYMSAILACYPKSPTGAEDTPIPNNSVQYVKETSRLFINMPKNLYPQDLQSSWTTVAGNATAGSVNEPGFGESESAASVPSCWSSYMDFEGSGEVDLRVKSTVAGAPDYFVRFIVSP